MNNKKKWEGADTADMIFYRPCVKLQQLLILMTMVLYLLTNALNYLFYYTGKRSKLIWI